LPGIERVAKSGLEKKHNFSMIVEEKPGIFFKQNAEENGDLERRKSKYCQKRDNMRM
jgi:hypothetical protein